MAAHLIHGSTEDRFSVTYCPSGLMRGEVEKAGFHYGLLQEMTGSYNPKKLLDGWKTLANGERIYYVSNPAVGLWASRSRFSG